MQDRTERWLTCSVGFSLFPVAANLLFAIGEKQVPWPEVLIGNGEFLLVSIGIVAAAVYELAATEVPTQRARTKRRLSTWAIATAILTSLYYASFAQGNNGGIVVISLLSYTSALTCGYWCLKLNEGGDHDVESN